ncbi:hypothetical protein BI355_1223 [Companilactobacillus crustorum]|nr:hypothetical protein BI355_1223 [Companilactobacillus crustorum]
MNMTGTIAFGKTINHRPIIISIIFSLLSGGLGWIINLKVAIFSFLTILFLLLFIYYPANLEKLFGHWQLENHGISYYKMTSYPDRLKIVLFPDNIDYQFISYSQIKSFKVIEQDKLFSSADLLTIKPASQSILPWLRKPFFLELELNQSEIDLDLSYDQLHDSKNTLFRLSNALEVLNKKI